MDEIKFGLVAQRPSSPPDGYDWDTPEQEAEAMRLHAAFWALWEQHPTGRAVSTGRVSEMLGRHEHGGQ